MVFSAVASVWHRAVLSDRKKKGDRKRRFRTARCGPTLRAVTLSEGGGLLVLVSDYQLKTIQCLLYNRADAYG